MKKPILMIIGCVMLLSISSFAYAAQELYFSGNVGLAIPSDGDFCTPLLPGNPEIESDNGLALAIAAGYDFGITRVECELAWQKNDLDKITIAGTKSSLSGETSSFALLINAYYDFVNNSAFTPFLSAGIGIAEVEITEANYAGSGMSDLDEKDRVMAFQFSAGVGYAVTETLSVDLKYRYFGTEDAEFDDADADMEYWNSNFYVGLRYLF